MRITVIGTRGIPNVMGGVETHCEELFQRVAKSDDMKVTVVRRQHYVSDALKEYKGVELYDVPSPKRKSFEAIVHSIRAVFVARFRLHADIVHIHAVGPALVAPLARMLGMKVVFTHHGPDYDREKWGCAAKTMLKFGERMGCVFANRVIVISETIKEIVVRKYRRTDACLIYNGVPVPTIVSNSSYLEELGLQKQKYVLAVGRFVPEKNFHQLVEAFAALPDSNFKLVLAGDADFDDDYSRELKRLAKEKGVLLAGFVKGEKLFSLFTDAACFVLPSSHEGLPISLLEAMSYGLPVLASDIPANKNVGLPSDDYFRCGDVDDLQKKLRKKLSEPVVRHSYDLSLYDWDKIAEQTVEVYKSVM